MEMHVHQMESLFAQLGLAGDRSSIDTFIAQPQLPDKVEVADANFWTPAQSSFLKEEILEDADWAEVVDELNSLLRRH
jgi:hypothetical protein